MEPELNIDPDGAVDWPAAFLEWIRHHGGLDPLPLNQSREAMTRRTIRAMENPHVNVIGHPTTRQIGRRDPVDLDLDAVSRGGGAGPEPRSRSTPTPTGSTSRDERRPEGAALRRSVLDRSPTPTRSAHLDAMRYGIGRRAARMAD